MSSLLERVLLVCLVIAVWRLVARAEVTFLGPTPYQSVADSPFEMSALGTTFFFEDFEDGSFDLPPGVTSDFDYDVIPSSPTTDSVDADHGVIDGYGTGGYSLHPRTYIGVPTNPLQWVNYFGLSFDSSALGFTPNTFGFVWTDGDRLPFPFYSPSAVSLLVAHDDGTVDNASWIGDDFLDHSSLGEPAEDRFLELRLTNGIARFQISMSFNCDTFIDQSEIDFRNLRFSDRGRTRCGRRHRPWIPSALVPLFTHDCSPTKGVSNDTIFASRARDQDRKVHVLTSNDKISTSR